MRQSALTLDSRTDSADWHSLAGWKRLALMGAMVCLPVPMLAASGLAVPLPAIVYRAAAGVAEQTQAVTVRVPGLGAFVSETTQVARRGAIRLAPEEVAEAAPASKHTVDTARPRDGARRERIVHGRNRSPAPKKLELRARPRQATSARRDRSLPAAQGGAEPESPQSSGPAHSDPALDHAPKRPEPPTGGSAPDAPIPPPEVKVDPPTIDPAKVPPPPPPTQPPPPPSPPPVAVTPPSVSTPPAPVPLTPKAQLEGIADDLDDLIEASPGTRRADRLEQVVDKVESAIAQLEETPPDNEGAVGDIRNATQKLDAALVEGVITPAERTLFVTRLNAVSAQLKAAP